MGTKNNPGKYDCYAKLEPDEPYFVLMGRDKHAPTLVWLWAVLKEMDQDDPDKAAEARKCCESMMQYAISNGIRISGLSQSLFAGMLELVRGVNHAVKLAGMEPDNKPMTIDDVRMFMLQLQLGEGSEGQSVKQGDLGEAIPDKKVFECG